MSETGYKDKVNLWAEKLQTIFPPLTINVIIIILVSNNTIECLY